MHGMAEVEVPETATGVVPVLRNRLNGLLGGMSKEDALVDAQFISFLNVDEFSSSTGTTQWATLTTLPFASSSRCTWAYRVRRAGLSWASGSSAGATNRSMSWSTRKG